MPSSFSDCMKMIKVSKASSSIGDTRSIAESGGVLCEAAAVATLVSTAQQLTLHERRQHRQLNDIFINDLSPLRKTSLNEQLCLLLAWLGNCCESERFGSSTYFRATTLFFHTFQIQSIPLNHYSNGCILASCLVLAYSLEEDDDLELLGFKRELASQVSVHHADISSCMRVLLMLVKHDLYQVEDIYAHYYKTLYEEDKSLDHQLFTAYLTLIRTNVDFLAFDNETTLHALNHCLFNNAPPLPFLALTSDLMAFDRCKKMVSLLINRFPLNVPPVAEEDNYKSLEHWGIAAIDVYSYLEEVKISSMPHSLIQALPSSFVAQLKILDECCYQLLSLKQAPSCSDAVRLTLQNSECQGEVLAWFSELPRQAARNKLFALINASVELSRESMLYVSDADSDSDFNFFSDDESSGLKCYEQLRPSSSNTERSAVFFNDELSESASNNDAESGLWEMSP